MTYFPTRLAACCFGFGLLLNACAAQAQAPTPAAAPIMAPGQARAALEIVQDPVQRAKLIGVLQALAAMPSATGTATGTGVGAASPAAPASAAAVGSEAVLVPDSLGAQVLMDASGQLSGLSRQVVRLVENLTNVPLVWNWLVWLTSNRAIQQSIIDAAWRLGVVMGLALLVEWLARKLVQRPLSKLRAHAPAPIGDIAPEESVGIEAAEEGQTEWMRRGANVLNVVRRLPYVLASFMLDWLPSMLAAAVGYGLLAMGMAGGMTANLVILAVLNGYVIWRLMVSLARMIASPAHARLRLLPVSSENAQVIVHDVAAIAAAAIAGYALAEVALLFGLYLPAHDALLKLVALVVYGQVVGIVMRNRRAMKQLLRAPAGSVGMMAALRNGLAAAWHRILSGYLLALWLVWAFEVEYGFSRLLRLMLATVLVAICARGVSWAAEAGLRRLLDATDGLDERYPGMGSRLATYHPMLRALLNSVVGLVAVVALLQAWGIDALSWFKPAALGGQVAHACLMILLTLVLALATWEGVNVAIARHLAELNRNAQLARSARLRTLLPMFRTVLLVAVCLVAGLVILSEIGVNIAPLLAGAGVLGLAIGFGSQKLVQDIITGLFLLLENTMQVGDVVSLGGLSGTVENLSIRTIRLRALDGAVHIVPFSAVTTVTNATRDYGYAVLDISLGLNETPDHIAEVLRVLVEQLRSEQPWKAIILSDLEVMGVDRFITDAWVMRARLKTLPASRWAVGRELNRRIKNRFDELAIESPMTSYRALGIANPPPGSNTQPSIVHHVENHHPEASL